MKMRNCAFAPGRTAIASATNRARPSGTRSARLPEERSRLLPRTTVRGTDSRFCGGTAFLSVRSRSSLLRGLRAWFFLRTGWPGCRESLTFSEAGCRTESLWMACSPAGARRDSSGSRSKRSALSMKSSRRAGSCFRCRAASRRMRFRRSGIFPWSGMVF